MEDPGTRIVSLEPDRRVISCKANANDVPLNGVYIIIDRTPGTSNDRESVLQTQRDEESVSRMHFVAQQQ